MFTIRWIRSTGRELYCFYNVRSMSKIIQRYRRSKMDEGPPTPLNGQILRKILVLNSEVPGLPKELMRSLINQNRFSFFIVREKKKTFVRKDIFYHVPGNTLKVTQVQPETIYLSVFSYNNVKLNLRVNTTIYLYVLHSLSRVRKSM